MLCPICEKGEIQPDFILTNTPREDSSEDAILPGWVCLNEYCGETFTDKEIEEFYGE